MKVKQFSSVLSDLKMSAGASVNKAPDPSITCEPDCQKCKGLGYYRIGEVNGKEIDIHHWAFGKLFPCENLPIESKVFDSSGLLLPERKLLWADVIERENVKEALDELKIILKAHKGMILLTGGVGLAKTLLLKIAIAECLKTRKGFMSCYRTEQSIMSELKDAMFSDDNTQSSKNIRSF